MIHTRPSTSVTPAQEPPPRVEARAATRVEDFDVDLREREISVTGIRPGPARIDWPFDELTALTRQFRWMSSSPRTARDGAPETAEGAVMDAERVAKEAEPAGDDASRHARTVSAASVNPPASADELGKRLFDVVFGQLPVPDAPLRARDAYIAFTARPSSRICLRAHHPTLRSVPWELLYDGTKDIPLAAADTSFLVRRVDLPSDRRSHDPTPVTRLSVLAIGSNPSNSQFRPLDLASEERKLQEALGIPGEPLAGAPSPAQVGDLRWKSKCDASELQELLERNEGGYHVLHFAGHAGVEGDKAYLYLTATDGEVDKLDASHLGHLLRAHPTIRLVVLNACEGAVLPAKDGAVPAATDNEAASIAERLAQQGVPAVIAMQSRIQDTTAVRFARELYTRLARLEPVDVAVSAARLALRHPDATTGEWAIPVLTLAVDDPRLFVPRPASPPAEEEAEPAAKRREEPGPAGRPPQEPQPVSKQEPVPPPPSVPPKRSRGLVIAALAATAAVAVAGVLAPYIFPQLFPPDRSASAQEGQVSQGSLLLLVHPPLAGIPRSPRYHAAGELELHGGPADIDARCKGYFYCARVGDIGFVPIPMNGVRIAGKGAVPVSVELGQEAPATLIATGEVPRLCPLGIHRKAGDRFEQASTLAFEYTPRDDKGTAKCVVTYGKQ